MKAPQFVLEKEVIMISPVSIVREKVTWHGVLVQTSELCSWIDSTDEWEGLRTTYILNKKTIRHLSLELHNAGSFDLREQVIESSPYLLYPHIRYLHTNL
jgi:hypothetical protein